MSGAEGHLLMGGDAMRRVGGGAVAAVLAGRRRARFRRLDGSDTPSSGTGSAFSAGKPEPVKESVASPTGYIRVIPTPLGRPLQQSLPWDAPCNNHLCIRVHEPPPRSPSPVLRPYRIIVMHQ